MYKEHSAFKKINDDCKIWRFMDFAKFCSILESSSLFFSKPINFRDPWEGHLTKKHFEEINYPDNMSEDLRKTMISLAKTTMPKISREQFVVNCWHINDDESEAFWRNYSERGIVIQTTFGKLKNSFKEEKDIFIGKVEYKNHNTETINSGNAFNMILWKRKSFEYEQELRAVIWDIDSDSFINGEVKTFDNIKGKNVTVDLEILIEKIYSTPFEKGMWFNNTVQDVVKRYGFNFPCIKSSLMDKPF